MTNWPHFASKLAVGFSAIVSDSDRPCCLSLPTFSRIATSISRYSPSSFSAHRRAMTGNDEGLVRYGGNIRLSRLDHPVDAAAGRVVDKGIDAIPVRIPTMKNIGFSEADGDVAVRMCGPVILQSKFGTVQVDSHV